jgi:HK97 family phage major capsid protein
MKQAQKAAYDRAEAALAVAEQNKREMTASEKESFDTSMAEAAGLRTTIEAREAMCTVRGILPFGMGGVGVPSGTFNAPANADYSPLREAANRNPEYATALTSYLRSGGKQASSELLVGADGVGGFHLPGSEPYTAQRTANGKMVAAAYEGTQGSSDGYGGYAVNVPTLQQVTPLAMPDMGIFDASLVVPTLTDTKIPAQLTFGTSAIKVESTGTTASFGGSDPTMGQTTLTAFMAGAVRVASWELLQDVEAFQQYIVTDLLAGQRILEGSLLATGNGTTQPLGVFGNTGTGTGSAYELLGTSADGLTLINSLFDVTASLKAAYQSNASWIMTRATGLQIRKAQMQSNLFVPVATVDADGTERILGRPVFYDVNAPSLPSATNAGVPALLYGDFKQGYIVGLRGGAGVNVKILDQVYAIQGQLAILCYRRLDARVRRSEAIQQVLVSHV